MSHKTPDCKIEYKKDEEGKAGTYCLTHNGVRVCNVCANNKEAHYMGPRLSHTEEEYNKAEKEIEQLIINNK